MYRKNRSQPIPFIMVTTAGVLDAAPTVIGNRTRDNDTLASVTGNFVNKGVGQMVLVSSSDDMNGNVIGFYFQSSGDVPVSFAVPTTAADPSDGVRLGLTALPNADAAAAGGLLTLGSNAGAVTIASLTLGSGLSVGGTFRLLGGISVSQAFLNRDAFTLIGNGTGAGFSATGGTTGIGGYFSGGATSGDGLVGMSNSGNGINGYSEANGAGFLAQAIVGIGARFSGDVGGSGTNPGFRITQGGTGDGLDIISSGSAIALTGGFSIDGGTTWSGPVNMINASNDIRGVQQSPGFGLTSAAIATAVWQATQKQLSSSQAFSNTGTLIGNVTGSVGSVIGLTSSIIGSTVWDVELAAHQNGNSTGFALNAAGAAGDPWGTAIPGAYGAGTAGSRLGRLPDIAVGAQGGLFISGSNAGQTTIGSLVMGGVLSVGGAVSFPAGLTANITGNLTGNVSGSVGSVSGAVGSVTGNVGGSVGSVTGLNSAIVASAVWATAVKQLSSAQVFSFTGNLIGDVTGSVGSVPGLNSSIIASAVWASAVKQLSSAQVFSFTGNLIGNVTGSVGSVTGAVGSVAGNVGGNLNGNVLGSVLGNITGSIALIGAGAIGATSLTTAALNAIADSILDRNMATGTDSGSATVRTVRQGLRMMRNKVDAQTGQVFKEDDSTESWTFTVTTAAGNPTVIIDPT